LKRGDVVLVALPGDDGKPRPAVVVQGDALTEEDCGSVVVCPLTTTLTGTSSFRVAVEPTAENGLRGRSEVMVEKLAGVARHRLREVVGRLDQGSMRAVKRALLLVLGFT
jgi:mRNA interferase MazF